MRVAIIKTSVWIDRRPIGNKISILAAERVQFTSDGKVSITEIYREERFPIGCVTQADLDLADAQSRDFFGEGDDTVRKTKATNLVACETVGPEESDDAKFLELVEKAKARYL